MKFGIIQKLKDEKVNYTEIRFRQTGLIDSNLYIYIIFTNPRLF